MSARNSSGWPCSNVAILNLYVFDSALDMLQRIFILMMSHPLTSYIYFLVIGIGGGLIHACTSALIQAEVEFFMIVYRYGLGEMYMMSHAATLKSSVLVLYGYS